MKKDRIVFLIACLLLAGCSFIENFRSPFAERDPEDLETPVPPAMQGTSFASPSFTEPGSPAPGQPEAGTTTTRPTREPPTNRQEYASLLEAGEKISFPIVTPGFVPDDLPLPIIISHEYADGHEELYLYYTRPGETASIGDKLLVVVLSNSTVPVSRENLSPPERAAALDVQEVTIGDRAGLTYWSPSSTMGNSAHLEWRVGELNMHLVLFGDWPAPDEEQPHILDELLLQIAASFQAAN